MFTESMLESIKKVEATRAARMGTEPRRMTAEEKSELLKAYHPDYREEGFQEIKIGPNKGQKAPVELTQLLHSNSRLLNEKIDLENPAYDVDVLVIPRCVDISPSVFSCICVMLSETCIVRILIYADSGCAPCILRYLIQ